MEQYYFISSLNECYGDFATINRRIRQHHGFKAFRQL